MIFYVTDRRHAYTHAVVILYHRRDLQATLRLVPFQHAELLEEISSGVVIWSDLDRMSSGDLERTARLSDALRCDRPGLVQLNHPGHSLQRYALLDALSASGQNGFRAFRPDEIPDDVRFPVFVRDEVGATYRAPELLTDRPALERAIGSLRCSPMVRPIIVEFAGRPGPDGYYRKYAAYRIGDRVFPQHVFPARNWFVKEPEGKMLPLHLEQHRTHWRDNPHAALLMPIFCQAKIEYGRIDYAFLDGRIEVFEINTNPTVLTNPPTRFDHYDGRPYADRHAEALLALPHATEKASSDAIDTVHAGLLHALRWKYRRKRAKLWLRKGSRQLWQGLTRA